MGTDIHMACEVRKNGKWNLVTDKVFLRSWCLDSEVEYTSVPFDIRSYDTFAILADVRNGYGFAGCKTGEGFNPISEPKGYPDDMCEELKQDLDDYSYGYLSNEHSASWLTLRELLDYDWTQTARSYGYVSEIAYKEFIMKDKMPDSWCGGVGGQNIVILTETEMVDLIKGKYPRDDSKEYYTSCYFNAETYAEHASWFYEETIPVLKKLIPPGGTTEDVRIVFDFDS